MLEHMKKELGEDGIFGLSFLLVLLIFLIGRYSFTGDKMNIGKENKTEHLDADEYVKGVQISISLLRNMPEDHYFVNGERFYKMRITLKYLEPFLALGIISSFFLPWINMSSMPISFYELLKLENFEFIQSLFLTIPLTAFCYVFYMCLFFSVLLIFLPLYKILYKETVLNRKKIAFNSKLLKPWLAFGLFGSFFLPWFNFNFVYLNGYEILLDKHYREEYWFVVLVPFFAVILAIHYRFNMKIKSISLLAGITPYITLGFMTMILEERFFKVFDIGAYFALCMGTVLIFLSLRSQIKFIFNKNKQ